MKGICVADHTWPEIETALKNGAIAILPIAACAKEHGRHLPMSTDFIQADWLISQLLSKLNVLVWPTVNYGYYPAFADYPGSCSLNKSTFENVVFDIAQNIIKSGAKKLYLLNTGISTIESLKNTVVSIKSSTEINLINVYEGKRFREVEKIISKQTRGSHADEIETSIMLAIDADKVNMDLAETNIQKIQPGPLNRKDKEQPNYSPSGVYGDARLATQEKGKLLLDAMLTDVLSVLHN